MSKEYLNLNMEHKFSGGWTSQPMAVTLPISVRDLKDRLRGEASYGLYRAASDYELCDVKGQRLPDNAVISKAQSSITIKPVFDQARGRLIDGVLTCATELAVIADGIVDTRLKEAPRAQRTEPDLLPNKEELSRILGVLQTRLGSAHVAEDAMATFVMDLMVATSTEGIERHYLAYMAPGPSLSDLLKQKARVPIVVGGAALLGMLLATTDPQISLSVGALSGLVSLLINILSDMFRGGEYHPKDKTLKRLLNTRFTPVRAGLLWVFLSERKTLSVKEILALLPYSETSVRAQLKQLEDDGFIQRKDIPGKASKWSMQ